MKRISSRRAIFGTAKKYKGEGFLPLIPNLNHTHMVDQIPIVIDSDDDEMSTATDSSKHSAPVRFPYVFPFTGMSLVQLKKACRASGLNVTGTRDGLQRRLANYLEYWVERCHHWEAPSREEHKRLIVVIDPGVVNLGFTILLVPSLRTLCNKPVFRVVSSGSLSVGQMDDSMGVRAEAVHAAIRQILDLIPPTLRGMHLNCIVEEQFWSFKRHSKALVANYAIGCMIVASFKANTVDPKKVSLLWGLSGTVSGLPKQATQAQKNARADKMRRLKKKNCKEKVADIVRQGRLLVHDQRILESHDVCDSIIIGMSWFTWTQAIMRYEKELFIEYYD
ncbi:hypothetical protein BDR26DRAFT_871833 [Obelidium mucronatum]|nr:hypothetical protein BDR26DRAFT_871833 [Obelidium mucronatum]